MLAFDHVLGADASKRDKWEWPYSHVDMFHEVFVMFGYLAGFTEKVELTTGVLILGQRQTALVAKQAAEVDVLSAGRLRLGIGVGWNAVEYEALGESFRNRGRRCEEQIELMRALWTDDVVTFQGRYHQVTDAGINPLPVQRPIPVWFGGGAEAVVRRLARIGDGWFPSFQPDGAGQERMGQMWEYAKQAGRDPKEVGVEGRISLADQKDPDEWQKSAEAWKRAGASHVTVNTMGVGLEGPGQHIEAISKFKEAVSG